MTYLGKDIKKLGFGLMRLPMIGEDVDIEQTKQMVDLPLGYSVPWASISIGLTKRSAFPSHWAKSGHSHILPKRQLLAIKTLEKSHRKPSGLVYSSSWALPELSRLDTMHA